MRVRLPVGKADHAVALPFIAPFRQRLFACIEKEPDAALSSTAVQEFLRGRLANFKVPKDIQFLDALPREASGKIFKRKLRDLYAEGRLHAPR